MVKQTKRLLALGLAAALAVGICGYSPGSGTTQSLAAAKDTATARNAVKPNSDSGILTRADDGETAIDAATFPDTDFQQFLLENIDSDGNGSLSAEEIESTTWINANDTSIKDFTGVSVFTNLSGFTAQKNTAVTELDLSQNTELTIIDLSQCGNLNSLKTGGCTKLEELYLGQCALTELDTAAFPNLKTLDCNTNKLTTLDVSANTKLEKLECQFNPGLTVLTLGTHPNINKIDCGACAIRELNTGGLASLDTLWCGSNQLESLDLNLPVLKCLWCDNNMISSLDFSGVPELTELKVNDNYLGGKEDIPDLSALTKLNTLEYGTQHPQIEIRKDADGKYYAESYVTARAVKDGTYPESSILASATAVSDSAVCWEEIPFSGYETLEEEDDIPITISYGNNKTKTGGFHLTFLNTYETFEETKFVDVPIDEAHFPDPVFRAYVGGMDSYFDKNQDGTLSADECREVTDITIRSKEMTEMASVEGISYFKNLDNFCLDAEDTGGDRARYTEIKEIDLSGNPNLRDINFCGDSCPNLETLNIRGCSKLITIWAECCSLSGLDLSSQRNLKNLYCSNNQFTSLDLSKTVSLEDLGVHNNRVPIHTLDVGNCSKLRNLGFTNSQVSEVILGSKQKLETIDCRCNMLTSLDASGLPALRELNIESNQITDLKVNKENLESLICNNNKLTSLDLSGAGKLKELVMGGNCLTDLPGLSGTDSLERLDTGIQYPVFDIVKNEDGTYSSSSELLKNIKEEDYGEKSILKTSQKTADGICWTENPMDGYQLLPGDLRVMVPLPMENGKFNNESVLFELSFKNTYDDFPEPEKVEVPLTEEKFPDEVFRSRISEICDWDQNGILDTDEIERTTYLGI